VHRDRFSLKEIFAEIHGEIRPTVLSPKNAGEHGTRDD
jgi:hypothetical protein